LGLRQASDHARAEQRGVTLHGDAHQEADLIVEHVTRLFGWLRRSGHDFQLLASHCPVHSAAPRQ
jgi:hypothetical protein